MDTKPATLSEEYNSVYKRVSLLREDEAKLIYAMGEIEKNIVRFEMKRDGIVAELQEAEGKLSAVKSALASTEEAYEKVRNDLELAKQFTMSEEKKVIIARSELEEEQKKLSDTSLRAREIQSDIDARYEKLKAEIADFEDRKSRLASHLASF